MQLEDIKKLLKKKDVECYCTASQQLKAIEQVIQQFNSSMTLNNDQEVFTKPSFIHSTSYHDDKPILEPEIIDYIAELVFERGSECYFNGEILPLLWEKFPQLINERTILGQDTMDVWFDSGISHWCVLRKES